MLWLSQLKQQHARCDVWPNTVTFFNTFNIYIALCFWSHFHHLEQQKLPVSVQSVEGLEPAVLCQRVRDLHDVVLSEELLSFNMEILIFLRGCYVIVFCSKRIKEEVHLCDGARGAGAELVEEVSLLQEQLLEVLLAPEDEVLLVKLVNLLPESITQRE